MTTIDRARCAARLHGTENAYTKHGCRCPDARERTRIVRKRRREGRHLRPIINSIGSQRRVRAMQALGYSLAHIAARLGYKTGNALVPMLHRSSVRRTLADRITSLYNELAGTTGPSQKTRNWARKNGYLPPDEWEYLDIDDPATLPWSQAPKDTLFDEVIVQDAVHRAKTSQEPRNLRTVDREEAVRRLAAGGFTRSLIAKRMRMNGARVNEILANHQKEAA